MKYLFILCILVFSACSGTKEVVTKARVFFCVTANGPMQINANSDEVKVTSQYVIIDGVDRTIKIHRGACAEVNEK